MEKQTKHRILGIIVVIALVIVLLPFFQGNKELSTEAALVTSPPFPDHPAVVASIPPSTPLLSATENIQPAVNPGKPEILAKTETQGILPSQQLPKKPASTPVEDHLKLKNSIWVVQIGSYKNKTNALNIVNQLRANGYHAFIQEMTSAFEKSTRVYVGPERKQATARTLASKLQAEMHVKGIVIHYKPLAL